MKVRKTFLALKKKRAQNQVQKV